VAFKRFLDWLWDEFDDPRMEANEFIDAGDAVSDDGAVVNQLVVSMTNRGRAKHATPSPRLGPVVLVLGASQMRTGRNTRRWFASRLGLFGAETLD
jgi:hypothetical protein